MLAVRSTHGLEVPLTDNLGRLIVDQNYIEFIANQANAKLSENEKRIKSYETRCNDNLFKPLTVKEDKNVRSLRTFKTQNETPQAPSQ